MKKLFTALAAFALLFTAGVQAAPVTWTLQNWVFDDGGTASGSFVFDASTNLYSSIMVTTTDGSDRSGASYASSNPYYGGSNVLAVWVTQRLADFANSPLLAVSWEDPLTDLGGTVFANLDPSQFRGEYSCGDVGCTAAGGPERYLLAGAAVTTTEIPLPSSLSLAALAFAALGFAKRRLG